METHWDFGDGTSSDQLMPAHSYDNSGIFTVTLTIVTESGCKSAYSAAINIAGANFTAAPAYDFRPTTDTQEPGTPEISVRLFPNPVGSKKIKSTLSNFKISFYLCDRKKRMYVNY